jgi:hypothetical protein
MLGEFHIRNHRRGYLVHNLLERTFLATGALLIALITLLLLFIVVYFRLV